MRLILMLILGATLLGGCGRKTPLTLPSAPSAPHAVVHHSNPGQGS